MVTGIRTVLARAGLCLLAACAVGGALTAPALAALPEYVGHFPMHLTSTGGKVTVETISKIKATCKATSDSGEITGPKTGTVTIKLTGCAALGMECATPGAKAGEVVTSTLDTTLGYINASKKEVGIALSTTGTFTEFACGPATVTVTGSVIGAVTPVDKNLKAGKPFALKFKQSKGKQKPEKLEGEPTDVLMGSVAGSTSEEAGLSVSDKLKSSEALEIRA
jgi:hypothetical protein